MTKQRASIRTIPLGFCLRVIVNANPLNLEKTTSSVISVLLVIYEGTDLSSQTIIV